MVPAAISGIRALALALTSLAIGALASDAALAAQGPGAGAGTAAPDADSHGHHRLWDVRAHRLRRIDRRAAQAAAHESRTQLAGPPVAAHARRDHRAARPVFLHIGRRAHPHRIRSGVVARVDIGIVMVGARIDRHAAIHPAARRVIDAGRGLRDPISGCASPAAPAPRCPQAQGKARQSPARNIAVTIRIATSTRTSISGRTVSDWRCKVNRRMRPIGHGLSGMDLAGTRAKQGRCGPRQKRRRSPKWKSWRTRFSSACRRPSASCAKA